MRALVSLVCLALVLGCAPESRSKVQKSSITTATVATKASTPPVNKVELAGQNGPTANLLQRGGLALTSRRTEQTFPDGNSIWRVDLHGHGQLLASWIAASGIAERQRVDRQWSPGNASPLPPGDYNLGAPEPWGEDLWFTLTPRFDTTRSALGIHRCYPGTGCICLPNRDDIEALAAWVREAGIRSLTVLN